MRRTWIVAGAVAVLATVGAVWWARDPRAPVRAPAITASHGAPMLRAEAPLPAREIDRSQRYRLTLDVEMRGHDATSAGAHVRITGELAAIASDRDDQGRERIRLVFTGAARTEHGTLPMPGLGAPYDAYYDDRGRLAGLAFADAVTPQARNTLAGIAAQLQLTPGKGAAWDAAEVDGLGPYRARYRRTPSGVARTKVAYETITADAALAAEVVSSTTQIALGRDGWPTTLASTERLNLGLEHARMIVATTLELERLDTTAGSVPPPVGAAVTAVDALSRDRAVEAAADRDLVDGASLADLLASRAAIVDDQHARGYQYLRIAALFRVDPRAAEEAERRLRATTDLDEIRALAGALGDSGAPAAQRALGKIASDAGLDLERRGQAVVALGLAPSPTTDALAALRAVIAGPPGELADAAWLALGNLSLRIRVTDPTTAAQVVDELLAALAGATAAQDDARLATIARALGNTGDPRIIPALAPLASSASWIVRAAALGSLRMVPDTASTRLLVGGLGDAGSAVRAAAVYAIGFHPPAAYVTALSTLYPRESSVDVRREILVVAATYLAEVASYHTLLERAAHDDASPELRELAAQALAST